MRHSLSTMRRQVLLVVAVLLTLGLGACAEETAGPEVGADVGDLQNDFTTLEENVGVLEEDVAGLEERIAELEDIEAADGVEPGVEDPAVEDELVGDDVLADTQSFVGQQVTVSAEVERILSTTAFTLSGPEGELLVIQATGAGDNEIVEEDAVVQVTGTVRDAFVITDVEEEFGIDLDDELFAEFEQQNFIVASSVSEAPTEDE